MPIESISAFQSEHADRGQAVAIEKKAAEAANDKT
jgi:hypothetical protein